MITARDCEYDFAETSKFVSGKGSGVEDQLIAGIGHGDGDFETGGGEDPARGIGEDLKDDFGREAVGEPRCKEFVKGEVGVMSCGSEERCG